MIIKYKTGSLEKVCTNLKEAKKKFNGKIPDKLLATVNFIEAADNLQDVVNYSPFHFHDLRGERKGAICDRYWREGVGSQAGALATTRQWAKLLQ